MTTVSGRMARLIGFDSFDDMPGLPPVAAIDDEGVHFDGDLTPAQADAVLARMTSRDDADQKARADIASLRSSVATADLSTPAGMETLRRAVLAGLDFVKNA